MFWYYDYWYLILVLPAMLLSLWASYRVNSTFKKFSSVSSRMGLTGHDSARRILDQNGLWNVKIERVSGNLTDHFDPKANVIRLSDSVYSSNSVAAIGVAAHEAGHAVQYAESYMPMKVRGKLVPVANIGSQAGLWLAILGIALSFPYLAYFGIALFLFVVLFQLVTLPVEFNASARALSSLGGYLPDDENKKVKKVLSAAALTYVAALLVSVANLLRLLLLAGGRRRND